MRWILLLTVGLCSCADAPGSGGPSDASADADASIASDSVGESRTDADEFETVIDPSVCKSYGPAHDEFCSRYVWGCPYGFRPATDCTGTKALGLTGYPAVFCCDHP